MANFLIKKDSVVFLTELSKNNNRDWFNNHKDRYVEAHSNIIAFADALLNDVFKKMRPFLDFMSRVLTTDANGVDVVD